MKLLIKILVVLLCVGVLCLPVTAAEDNSSISSANTVATVESDGSCTVEMSFNVRLKSDDHELKIFLPDNAKNVRLDGKLETPSTDSRTGNPMLNLSKLSVGVQTVEISFTVSDAITVDGDVLKLEVPLLAGASLPIEEFHFSANFPNAMSKNPTLSTVYYGQDVGERVEMQVKKTTVSGKALQTIQDHDGLTLTYRGDREMFPDYTEPRPLLGGWDTALAVLMVASLVYYLVALFPRSNRKIRTFSPPEGLAAGDVGTCLTGCGMDLTMMVFSWAQMGYLTIQLDKRGRVRLHKQMEMGPERSEFENRAFRKLFSGRQTIDGGGLHYARLYRNMAKKSPLLRQIYVSKTGNPQIVRYIAVGVGALGGLLMSLQVYSAGVGTVLLALLMVAVCGVLSYLILFGCRCIPMGNRRSLWISALSAVVWLLLGLLCNSLLLGLGLVAYEALIGLAAAVGGRRSEIGRQYVAQIRGLRTHLTRGSVFDMQQCQQRNPAYFCELMPYALALGVEKQFARRFGRDTACECDYMMVPGERTRTTNQWAVLLRQAADCLDRRQQRLQIEQLLYRFRKK